MLALGIITNSTNGLLYQCLLHWARIGGDERNRRLVEFTDQKANAIIAHTCKQKLSALNHSFVVSSQALLSVCFSHWRTAADLARCCKHNVKRAISQSMRSVAASEETLMASCCASWVQLVREARFCQ